ncbi:hypothetical protein L1049_025930 [Liquidambar formosana]|uniref:Uncharacterized protein n=1 Tax=Liquidambar formosana TaxID=63359 RepID=A0AAP0NE00_LIQFO
MDFEPLSIENEVIEFDMGSGEEDTALDLEHQDDEDYYNDELAENSSSVTGAQFVYTLKCMLYVVDFVLIDEIEIP